MRASNVLSRISLHFTLIVLVVWSVLPFVWTMQTSIKFTRDVASKEPVLWGYETTGNAYRNFWLDTDRFEDGEASLWNVLWYVLAVLAVMAIGIEYQGANQQVEKNSDAIAIKKHKRKYFF